MKDSYKPFLCPALCDTYHFQCILQRIDLTLPLQDIFLLVIEECDYSAQSEIWRQYLLKDIAHEVIITRKMNHVPAILPSQE